VKAKRRVVTGAGAPTKRRPTVRRIKPAIAPLVRKATAAVSAAPAPVVVPVPEPAFPVAPVDLSVDLGRGLVLRNPVLVASGTFGYGIEYGDVVDVQRLGAICCKGTTLRPRIGNPTPRVTETPGGMLNSIGLQNPGVDAVVAKYASTWAGWDVPVIVNVAGESIADYVEVVRRLETGGVTLEESLALWERGEALAAVCQQWLDGARARLDEALAAEGRSGEQPA